MSNIQELQQNLITTNQKIENYIRANPNIVQRDPNNPNLARLNAYKKELIQEISEIQYPPRVLTREETIELGRILAKVEITRTPSEAAYLASHINMK